MADPVQWRRGTSPAMRDPEVRRIAELVCRELGVPTEALFQRSRGVAAVAHARQLAMYLCYVCLGRKLATVGRLFGRDRSTASYACARIEDLRDDDRFEARVCRLEELIQATASDQEMEPIRAAG